MTQPQPAAQPPKPEAPPPAAPSFAESAESALKALVQPGKILAALAGKPAPGFGASLALCLAWGAAFFVFNLAHAAVSSPASLARHAPVKVAIVAVIGLGAWTALSLLGASLAYALGRGLGTRGDFDRAAQLVAVALVAAPLQGLCNWLPAVWALPALAGGWIAAEGLIALFGASALPARLACLLGASVLVLGQFGARIAVERFSDAARSASMAASMIEAGRADGATPAELDELQRSLEAVQARSGAPGASGLDLLRGPEGESRPKSDLERSQDMVRGAQDLQQNAAGMLDAAMPMLSNPAITRNMNPAQKAALAELQGMMAQMKDDLKAGRRVSDKEQQARMAKMQALTMSLMSAGLAAPAPAPEAKK